MSRNLAVKDNRRYKNLLGGDIPPIWKTYLYHLQQQAPTPKRIICHRQIPNKPSHYGRDFHGAVSREEADKILTEEGSYLVRESQRAPGQFTLSMKFRGQMKNFKLYFDGKHYVGEKRFDTVQDLVADGLITLYMEAHAGNYISMMHQESTYAESPYMTLNPYRDKLWKVHQRTLRKNKQQQSSKHQEAHQPAPSTVRCESPESPHDYETPPLEAFLMDEEDEDIDVSQFEKPHNFKTHNFKGLPWCDFCGNFMWGLIAQGVKCEDCGLIAHNKCSEKIPNECLPDLQHVKRIFGVDLTTLVKAHNTLRPFVVDMCVKEIETRGLDTEGIYRVPGFNDAIEDIKNAFERDGEKVDISTNVPACEDINVIAGVLKLFFRLLPIPLVTYDTYSLFLASVRHTQLEQRLQSLKEAIAKLPPAHYQTLKFLLGHLSRVAERSRINMMTGHNLSTIFCPNILRSPEIGPTAALAAWHLEALVMEMLISHQKTLFAS